MKQETGLKILLGVGLVVVSASLYLTIQFGVAPRPIPLIKPTEVANITSAGVLTYRRMRQELRAQPLLVTGSLPLVASYEEFWQGFHLAANQDNAQYLEVFFSLGLKLFKESSLVPAQATQDLYFKDLKALLSKPRSLIYTHSLLSSHFAREGLSSDLSMTKTPAVVITLHPFVVTREQVQQKNNGCEKLIDQASVISKLDCIAEAVTKQHYKKKLDPKKNYVALYRYGRQDYVAFYYEGLSLKSEARGQ